MSKTKWYRKAIYLLVALALVLSLGIVALPMAGTVEANPGTIQDAINAASPGGIINVAPGTYNEHVVIDKSLTLIGAGAASTIVDGGGGGSVFLIGGTDPSVTVTISGLTIQNGSGTPHSLFPIYTFGGGICNYATVILHSCVVTGNTVTYMGGGILNNGTMTIDKCTISGNTASGQYGASGGGIMNYMGATLIITKSTISGNSVGCNGGGIMNGLYGTVGTLTMTDCTVSGNTAGSAGGGIAVNHISGTPGVMTLTHVTITGNSVTGGNNQGGGIFVYGGTHIVRNSIIAGNTASIGPPNIMKSVCSWTQFCSITSGDPLLGPLQDNGGPTETHALLPGSPAIDAGDDSYATSTDQRGVPRPLGAYCDIGAYEGAYELEQIVDIDIKPGSYPNSINLKSKGVVAVAVLTTDDFDASTVDPDTVSFAGAEPVRWTMEDVDRDGDLDMLFHFNTQDLDLTDDSSEAHLTGETSDGNGTYIWGKDTVNIVPKGKK